MTSAASLVQFSRADYAPQLPTKHIFNQNDVDRFVKTGAYARLITFIDLFNQSVLGKKISDPCPMSPQTERIVHMLDTLDAWLEEFPPLENPQRFGNKAFRSWLSKVEEEYEAVLKAALAEDMHAAIPELGTYLVGGFGNGTRIDYGSGHELSFFAFLCGITMLGGFAEEDYQAVVLRIFVRYLELVRKIQRRYTLEPAGSHGVWGLDDHQFLPYMWGSAQLINHPSLPPKSITDKAIVDSYAGEYMYYRCIQYIHEVKRGPFHEHSPLLHDISAVRTWSKVNTGLAKMYVAEVLKKTPVIQHFPFGALFPFH